MKFNLSCRAFRTIFKDCAGKVYKWAFRVTIWWLIKDIVIVSPEQFKNAFLDEVVKKESELLSFWYDKRKYTSAMKGGKGSVLELVAKSLGLSCYFEYWSMDSVFYKERDTINFNSGFYARNVSVGVEHENDRNGSQCEMSKLALWSLPLGVLITYRHQGNDKFFLDSYSDIVRSSNWMRNAVADNELLVVFGDKVDGSISWDFFSYKNSVFEKF